MMQMLLIEYHQILAHLETSWKHRGPICQIEPQHDGTKLHPESLPSRQSAMQILYAQIALQLLGLSCCTDTLGKIAELCLPKAVSWYQEWLVYNTGSVYTGRKAYTARSASLLAIRAS